MNNIKKYKKNLKIFISKFGIFLLAMCMLLGNIPFSSMIEANAATVSAEYAFSPRFIEGVTTCEKVNAAYYITPSTYYDVWRGGRKDGKGYMITPDIATYNRMWSLIDYSNLNKEIGIRYNNVGTYNGQIVDLIATVKVSSINAESLTATVPLEGETKGRYNRPMIGFFTASRIAFNSSMRNVGDLTVKCTYYKHGTNTTMNLKSFFSLTDIDPGECFTTISGIDEVARGLHMEKSGQYYKSQDSCFHGDIATADVTAATTEHWATLLTSGSSFSFSYGHTYDIVNNFVIYNRSFYEFGLFGTASLAAFDTPALYKSASTSTVQLGSTFQYMFETTIPAQSSGNEYTKLVITDTLPDAITLANGQFTVYDDGGGENISSKFSMSLSGQLVTLTCRDETWLKSTEAANKTYRFTINVKPKTSGYTYPSTTSGVYVSNTAKITTDKGTKTSNPVTTEIVFKVDTKLTGKGTITGVSGSNGGSGSIQNIKGGATQSVSWQAATDYYVTSVKIDGVEQSINSYIKNGSKTFSSINTNHAVEVVTLPRPKFDITKTTDKQYYNAEDDVEFTVSFKLKENTASRAYNVKLQDLDMTDGITLDRSSISVSGIASSRYTLSDDNVFSLTIPYLDQGETVTIKYKGKVETNYVTSLNENISNNMTNTARVTSDGIITTGNDSTWESATVTPPVLKPVVTITKDSDKEKYNVGDIVTYQITVNQTKENAIAHNVVITDNDYTNGITMTLDSENDIQITDAQGNALDSSLYNVSITNYESFVVTITRLEYNQPVIISVKGVLTEQHLAGKNIKNTAEATCENNPKDVKATTTAIVYKPNLTISKIADRENKTYNVNDIVTYTVQVNQTVSGARANYVVVNDILPNKFVLDSSSFTVYKNSISNSNKLTSGYSLKNSSDTTWSMVIDDITTSCYIVYKAHITDVTLAGRTDMKNIVTAQATNFFDSESLEPTVVTADETVKIAKPNLEIKKTTGGEIYNVGDSIDYIVEVEQTEKLARANDVVIYDKIGTAGVFIKDYSTFIVKNESGNVLTETTSNDRNFSNGDYYFTKKSEEEFEISCKDLSVGKLFIYFKAVIQDGQLAGKNVTNTAYTKASNFLRKLDNDTFEPIIREAAKDVILKKPEIQITKVSDKEFYNVGDEIKYTVEVKQTAENARANDVVITDTLPSGVSLKADSVSVSVPATVKTINNGRAFTVSLTNSLTDSFTFTYTGIIQDGNLAGKNIVNTVIADWSNNPDMVFADYQPPKGIDESSVLLPKLEVTKSSVEDYYNVGDEIKYTVEVKQTAENARANDVVITDTLPTGVSLKAHSVSVSVPATVKTINNGRAFTVSLTNSLTDSFTFTYIGIIQDGNLAGKNIVNTAVADWSNNPYNDKPEGKSTDPVLLPKLKVEKNADKFCYNVKDTITYTINVSQLTTNARANDVVINDVVPNGLKLNESSIQSSANADIGYNKDNRTITIALKQGLTDNFTITYSAVVEDGSLAGKNVINTAVADWSNNPENNEPEGKSTDPVLLPVLTVTKNSGKNSVTYNVKDTLPFEVIVKQTTKNAVANDVVISDRMAVADIDVNIDSIKVYNVNGDLLIKGTDYTLVNQYDETTHKSGFDIKLASLSDQIRLTYDAVINNNNVAGKSVSNHVVVTASNNQGEKPTARSEEAIPEPFVKVEKKSDKTHYNVGDIALFTITVNQIEENARANDVVITDEMIEDGVSLSYESIKVFFNDNEITPEITQTEKGFVIPVGNVTDKDTVVIKYSAVIMDNELSGHDFSNDASAVWTNNPNYPDGTKTTSESYILKPQLLIEKVIDNDKLFNIGDTVDYTVRVSIDSEKAPEARANNVVVEDAMLEDGVIIDFDSLYLDEYAKGQYDLDVLGNSFKISGIDRLNDGETLTIHYQAKVVDPSLVGKDFSNTASATCDNNPEIVEDDANGSIVAPKLEILKDVEFGNYNLSDIVNYTITVNQLVPNARANDVVITDILDTDGIEIIPDSIKLVSGSDITVLPVSDSDLTIVSDSDLTSASSNGFVVKTSAVEKSFVVKYQAKIVDKNLMGESFTNKAYVTSSNYLGKDNEPVIEKASVTANVYEPVLSIEKTSDRYTYNLYDIVHFNVKVTQTVENAIARGVVINDSFINQGVEIDPDTIVVKNFLPEDYEITQTGNGYEIAFNVPILYNQLIEIEYDAKITDPSLVDCILEHDIYTSCVTNVNTTGVWHDDVAIEVLKPDIMITKSSDKTEAYGNETVKYTVTITQTAKDANSFNLIVTDVIEDNMSIDMESITVSSSDMTLNADSIEFRKNDENNVKNDGFVAYIPHIKGENSVTFTYNAKVLDETRDTSTNVVSVTGDTLKDGIEAKATINILKTPVTGEADTLPIAMSIMLVSLGLFIGVVYLRKKQYASLDA